jgi:hypothetical protein
MLPLGIAQTRTSRCGSKVKPSQTIENVGAGHAPLRTHALMRTQTPGAYAHPLRAAVHLQAYLLNVGQPTCIGMSFGVAYVVAELAYLATNLALGHL